MKKLSAFQKAKQLLIAQIRGQTITSDFFQSEFPQHYLIFIETAKETILLIGILWIIFPSSSFMLFGILSLFGWIIWKTSQESYLGWKKLQILHRIIEEERWEIEHHRPQERKELEAIYNAKGLSGTLLDDVIDVFMANDNRLLQIMLEEEMGIVLESYDHPLKLGFSAALAVGITTIGLLLSYFWFANWGIIVSGVLWLSLITGFSAKRSKSKIVTALIWQGGIFVLVLLGTYFFMQLVS